MQRITVSLVAMAMVFYGQAALSSEKFIPAEGNMMVGGTATLDVESRPVYFEDEQEYVDRLGFKLNLSPVCGYFVTDEWMVYGQLLLGAGFAKLYEVGGSDVYPKNAGIGVGVRKYSEVSYGMFYWGAGLRFTAFFPDEGDSVNSTEVLVPIGVLLPLNRWVGLDFGTRISYDLEEDSPNGGGLHVPLGYLGVQAFF